MVFKATCQSFKCPSLYLSAKPHEDRELREELAKCREKLATQEKNYEKVCTANSDLQEKYIQRCQEIDSERALLIEAKKQVSDSDEVIKNLQIANENFQAHAEKLMTQLVEFDSVAKSNAELQKEVKSVGLKMSEYKSTIAEKDREVKRIQDWNLRLQAEIKSKESSAHALESEKKKFGDELVQKVKVLNEFRDAFVEMQDILKGKDESIRSLRDECEAARGKMATMEKSENEANVDMLYAELEKVRNSLNFEALEKEKLQAENKELRIKLLNFYSEMHALQSEQTSQDGAPVQSEFHLTRSFPVSVLDGILTRQGKGSIRKDNFYPAHFCAVSLTIYASKVGKFR